MSRIERFEDLEAWKLARVLTVLIYDVSGIGEFSRDFALRLSCQEGSTKPALESFSKLNLTLGT